MGSNKKKIKRALWVIVGILAIISLALGWKIYQKIFTPNVHTIAPGPAYLFIPTGSDITDVMQILDENKLLRNEESFLFTAKQLKYDMNVKPGRYLLKDGMNNKDLITLLRSGRQSPLNLVFNNIRTKEQLAERVAQQIEAKSSSILNLMDDKDYIREFKEFLESKS